MLLAVAASAAPKKSAPDPRVVGSWAVNGETMFVFKADGSGRGEDGPFHWSLKDGKPGTLLIKTGKETQKVKYGFMGEQLVLRLGWIPVTLDKASGPASAGKAAKPAAAAQGGGKMSRLLLSSAWCSFSYNKVSGASSQSRAVFSPDGTWATYSQREGYSSGSGGTYSSQNNASDGGRWREDGGEISMSTSENPQLSPVEMRVSYNSNGSPIITADGVEYASCR